jgi:hypothetical protein
MEDTGANLMQSHEAHPGVAVRVKEGYRKSGFGGLLGTVEQSWGHPDFPALDVRFEDGRSELFWFHELEKPDVESAPRSLPFYDGS